MAMFEANDGIEARENLMSVAENRDLDFTLNPKEETWSWAHFEWDELKTLAQKELSYNSHFYGFSPDAFKENIGIREIYKTTSISQTFFDQDFVASMEGINLPFSAYVYHPEKPAFNYQDAY
jgi:gamma-glutamyl hydrolase